MTEPGVQPTKFLPAIYRPDQPMRSCRVLAQAMWDAPGVLSHQPHARRMRDFLIERIEPDTPERIALLSIVEHESRIALYLSCGERAIVHSLGVLLRLALAWQDHPDYHEAWKPS